MTDAGCTNSGILSVLQQDESYLQLDIIGGLVKHQTTAANLQQPDIFRLPLEYSKGIWVVSLDKTQLLSFQNQMKVEWRVLPVLSKIFNFLGCYHPLIINTMKMANYSNGASLLFNHADQVSAAMLKKGHLK